MHIEFQWSWQAAGTACCVTCTEDVEIVESGDADWRPWEPPLWLIGLGLSAALIVGLVQSGHVRDPRVTQPPPAATPCVPTSAAAQREATSYVWTFCP